MIRHAERKVYSGVSRANHGVVRTMRKSGSPRTQEHTKILSNLLVVLIRMKDTMRLK
jgi:hypothetical protein